MASVWLSLSCSQTNLFSSSRVLRASHREVKETGFRSGGGSGRPHSEYDNHVLNYVKSGVPPSLCWNVSFSTEEFYCPTFALWQWHGGGGDRKQHWPHGGICSAHLLECTLWLWHNFACRTSQVIVSGRFFVSQYKAWKRKENNPDAFCEMPSARPPFIMQVGVSFVRSLLF